MGWGDRARLGGGISERTSPEEQLDKNAGLYTADQVSRRCGEGGLLLLFFSFFCKSVELQETRGLGRNDEVGGRLLGAGSRGRGGRREAADEGAVAVSSCFEKQSRINPKDCHSFVSELCSLWEGHVSTSFSQMERMKCDGNSQTE